MSKKLDDINDRITSYPNPTFSSSVLNHIDRQSTAHPHLHRSRLVHKWIDKPTPKLPPVLDPPPPAAAAADEDPDSFFSTTSVSSSDSSFGGFSSTASEAETPSFNGSSKPRTSCFGPPRAPKPVKTGKSEGISEDECSTNKSSSRAVKIYSQLKNLKQPISPGLKLTKYINSLFVKESSASKKMKKTKNLQIKKEPDTPPVRKFRGITVPERKYKSEQTSPESSFSGSSLTKRYLASNAALSSIPSPSSLPKRTVKFCPVSVILGDDKKPVYEGDMGRERLTRRYEELRRMSNIRMADEHDDMNRKVLEEVAVDLPKGYWNRKQDDNGGIVEAVNADDSSCSSSDLFELDHLSLIGNDELPMYETTNQR